MSEAERKSAPNLVLRFKSNRTELAAVCGEMRNRMSNDRARADGRIHHRLKGDHRR